MKDGAENHTLNPRLRTAPHGCLHMDMDDCILISTCTVCTQRYFTYKQFVRKHRQDVTKGGLQKFEHVFYRQVVPALELSLSGQRYRNDADDHMMLVIIDQGALTSLMCKCEKLSFVLAGGACPGASP